MDNHRTAGRFSGRVAIVTGSTQGLGEALLHRLADEGLGGAVVTGRGQDRGRSVVEALESKGCEAIFVSVDLGDAASVASIVPAAEERFGVVDHLANCAADNSRGDVWDTTPELFDRMMAVNLRAPFQLVQDVAKLARKNGRPATIVNVGSVAGYGGAPFITPYSISKGGLSILTKTAASQLMRDRVRVVQVNPGWMDTPGEDAVQRKYHGATDGWLERVEAKRPFGRLIKVDEIVTTLAFVLSDESGMMTGAIIDYDQTVHGAGESDTA